MTHLVAVVRRLIICVLAFLLHVPVCLHAGGDKITLFLQNRSVVIGELLCICDSELVLATRMGCSDEELGRDASLSVIVPMRDIQEVKLKGKSYVLTGVAIGTGAGLVVGAAIALAQPRPDGGGLGVASMEHNQKMLGLVLGSIACGLFIGGALGEAASTGDRYIVLERKEDFTVFKEFARFQDEEPDFFKHLDSNDR